MVQSVGQLLLNSISNYCWLDGAGLLMNITNLLQWCDVSVAYEMQSVNCQSFIIFFFFFFFLLRVFMFSTIIALLVFFVLVFELIASPVRLLTLTTQYSIQIKVLGTYRLCKTNQVDHKPGKPRVLRDFYERGKLWEFCATSQKIFNKQNSFSLIKYLCNTLRSWASNEQSREFHRWSQCVGDVWYYWSWCGMTLDIGSSLLYLLFVAMADGQV